MTPNPFQTAQAVFSPDPDDPRLEVVRFERDDQRVGTGYCYERDVEPSAHQQQRMEHVAAAGWLPRPDADTIGDVWEVEHRALGWDGLVPGMSGTATITNVTEHGADVAVTSADGERLEQVGITLTSGTTDGTMGQQLAYELRELGWDVAGDQLTDGQVVTWRGDSADITSTTLDVPTRTKRSELMPPSDPTLPAETSAYPAASSLTDAVVVKAWLERAKRRHKKIAADHEEGASAERILLAASIPLLVAAAGVPVGSMKWWVTFVVVLCACGLAMVIDTYNSKKLSPRLAQIDSRIEAYEVRLYELEHPEVP